MTVTFFNWTGVGSRQTPPRICDIMKQLAEDITSKGGNLRSGHADGADLAFEAGCKGRSDIYLPWDGFNKDIPVNGNPIIFTELSEGIRAQRRKVLIQALTPTTTEKHLQTILNKRSFFNLHCRNACQVLGHDYTFVPSKFLLFYAQPLGSVQWKGGTNTAVQIARLYKVPYFNLYDLDWSRLNDFIDKAIKS